MSETIEYEYRDLLAQTWDLGRGDTTQWSDRPFFLEIVRQFGEPVLDVGCGTGRILLDFLAQGIDVDGVDNSPEMLTLCRSKADSLGLSVQLFEQPMETLSLTRRYRTMIVPSSSFQLLTEKTEAEKAIRNFYAHLSPGGVLVMPFSFEWKPGTPLQTEWEKVFEKVRPEDGLTIRRWAKESFSPEKQLWHTEDRYEILQDDKIILTENHRRSPAGLWYTQAQAVALYEKAGFVDVRVSGGFTFDPALPDESLFCVRGIKP